MSPHDGSRIGVVIVDDEALARGILREWLSTYPDIDILAECGNGFEAVKATMELKPDLLMLDIQMPKLDGFDVLELIGGDIPVIFITAYDSYAVRAFEVHAVDYLLKPFSAERLGEALERARARIRSKEQAPVKELLASARPDRTPLQRILIREKSEVHVIPVSKIDYLESQDDYVSVKCGNRSYLKEQPLGELETQLDPMVFVRIHRRYVLNLARLAKIETGMTDSRIAVLNDGTQLPISRTGYARLKELL